MRTIKLSKGLNIEMPGKAAEKVAGAVASQEIAVVPDHFVGITPKVAVKEGDSVQAGSVLLYDKNHPEVKILSPVSGEVTAVARGERRKLLYVSVKANGQETQADLPKISTSGKKEEVAEAIFAAGFGALIRQRPYDVVANLANMPKAIFVSAFDSAPLAPDYNFILKGEEANLQAGLTALSRVAKVYYSVSPATSPALRNMKDVEVNEFVGKHPAGLVGVQMNHLDPVNKGEYVWSMNVQDVAMMGRYINSGKLDLTRKIAVAGAKVKDPAYVTVLAGSKIGDICRDNLIRDEHLRIINGNPLTGLRTSEEDALSPFAAQVTVIAEGDETDEMLGWAMPRLKKFSSTRLFATKLQQAFCKNRTYDFDARICGGERAFIMSGEYDRVFPMDILPEQLVKAMIARNLDHMEQLGAYEVAPEDFALCEFVCTSKIETQRIVREALDYMRKELE